MNDIVTPIRNSLKIKSCNADLYQDTGTKRKRKSFVKKWLRRGRRSANCVTSVKCSHIDQTESPFGCFVELVNAETSQQAGTCVNIYTIITML